MKPQRRTIWMVFIAALLISVLLFCVVGAERMEPDRNASMEIKSIDLDVDYQAGGLQTADLTTGLTPGDLLANLLGSGVTITDVRYTGADVAAGTFTGGTGIIGFEEGIILSTGRIDYVIGPNEYPNIGWVNGEPGDADLDALIPGYSTFDAAVLEFDFIPTTSVIHFEYVFASDEYNEYVGSPFNDVFGFFLNGQNIAVIPGTLNTPVSINNVNLDSYSQYYVNNDVHDGPVPAVELNTEMDGLTTALSVTANVAPGQVNTIKLAIADAGDDVLDSNVFLKAESIAAPELTLYPFQATNEIGESHTITAVLQSEEGDLIPGATIEFIVMSGPHEGFYGTAVTGSSGTATWSYTGTTAGTDTIVANYGNVISNYVYKTWELSPGPTPTPVPVTTDVSYTHTPTQSGGTVTGTITATGVTDYSDYLVKVVRRGDLNDIRGWVYATTGGSFDFAYIHNVLSQQQGVQLLVEKNGQIQWGPVDLDTGNLYVELDIISGTFEQGINIGTAASATRGYDSGLDAPHPPEPPSAQKYAASIIDDLTFPTLSTDFKPLVDENNPTETWEVYVKSNEPITVTWNVLEMPGDLYLTWNDGTGNVDMLTSTSTTLPAGEYTVIITHSISPGTELTINLKQGWNLISVPFTNIQVNDPEQKIVIIYQYNTATRNYEAVSTSALVAGRGYWVAASGDTTITITGTPVTSLSLTLAQGWNLIGGTNAQVPFSSIVITPTNAWAMQFMYGYNTQTKAYETATTLQPGRGYWAAVTSPATITLGTPGTPYELTMVADPSAGGTVAGAGSYAEGTAVQITATPSTGYQFLYWTAPAGTFADINSPTTTFTMPGEDVTVTARFLDYAEEEEEFDTPCGQWSAAHEGGGVGIHEAHWNISKVATGSVIDFKFDAIGIPDRFWVYYNGALVYQSGWRGDAWYDGNPLYPGGVTAPPSGEQLAVITKIQGVNTMTIKVEGAESGTWWYYWLKCRVP